MSDRLELLKTAGLITPAVKRLIAQRIVTHEPLIREGDNLTPKQKGDVKVALLAIRIINDVEEFFDPEEALMRGISTDTLATRRKQVKTGQREMKQL